VKRSLVSKVTASLPEGPVAKARTSTRVAPTPEQFTLLDVLTWALDPDGTTVGTDKRLGAFHTSFRARVDGHLGPSRGVPPLRMTSTTHDQRVAAEHLFARVSDHMRRVDVRTEEGAARCR
jgi:hypothetical protein